VSPSSLAEERVAMHYESAQEMLLWARTTQRKVSLGETHAWRAFSVEKGWKVWIWELILAQIWEGYEQWKHLN
jgi:hypothetical protein